jgi:hypothetical protein
MASVASAGVVCGTAAIDSPVIGERTGRSPPV